MSLALPPLRPPPTIPAPSSCRCPTPAKTACNLRCSKKVWLLSTRILLSLRCFPGRLWGGSINSSDAPVCDEARGCVFVVGQPLPDTSSITALSNTVVVDVEWRAIRLPAEAHNDVVCLDWEPWVRSPPCFHSPPQPHFSSLRIFSSPATTLVAGCIAPALLAFPSLACTPVSTLQSSASIRFGWWRLASIASWWTGRTTCGTVRLLRISCNLFSKV